MVQIIANFNLGLSQLKFTCSESTIETLEKRSEICSKITIKTPERPHSVFIVNLKIFPIFF